MMRDYLGVPIKEGTRCVLLGKLSVKCTIIRFTKKMVIIQKENKYSPERRCFPKDLINIEPSYEKYPELLL